MALLSPLFSRGGSLERLMILPGATELVCSKITKRIWAAWPQCGFSLSPQPALEVPLGLLRNCYGERAPPPILPLFIIELVGSHLNTDFCRYKQV